MIIVACSSCKHFNSAERKKDLCSAFPNGIPESITSGNDQHRVTVEGDRGIKWEPLEGLEFFDVPMPPPERNV